MADAAAMPAPSSEVALVSFGQESKSSSDFEISSNGSPSPSDGDTVQQALALKAEHDSLEKQAQDSDSVLGLEKYNTAMPVGLRALHKELSAFQVGTFRNLWRGSSHYLRMDSLLVGVLAIMALAATAYTFWAPQWVAVAIRIVFQDGDGNMSFSDFCGWLFLYVATLAMLWAGTSSLLYVLYSRFVQRLRYHFAHVGDRLYSKDSQISDSLFLERVESDVAPTGALWFKTLPAIAVCLLSVLLGLGMIFSHSWKVGFTSIGLFAVFMLLSFLVDEIAVREASSSVTEKRREDALWSKLHDHTTSPQERKDLLLQINRVRALRAGLGSHGLLHVLVGVLYRVLAFCTPVVLFLVAGNSVVDKSMDQYEVVVVSVYFAYVVVCAFTLNGVMQATSKRVGAGVKLMGFVNQTHGSLSTDSRVRAALGTTREQQDLRMATPWVVILLSVLFLAATAFVTGLLMDNSSGTNCPTIQYTCSVTMTDINWSNTLPGSVEQKFDLSQGCALEQSTEDILSRCSESVLALPSAPRNRGLQMTRVTVAFPTWAGSMRTISRSVRLSTPSDNLYNTNPVREVAPVDVGAVVSNLGYWVCDIQPCGMWPNDRGVCLWADNPVGYYCLCHEGYYGWDCIFREGDIDIDDTLQNTTKGVEEIDTYKQCLNESINWDSEAEELCDNLTQAVDHTNNAVTTMVELYWWSYSHDDEMIAKQARKYQEFYDNELREYEAAQAAIRVHERRQESCMNLRALACLFSGNREQCLNNLQQVQNVVCNIIEKWIISPEQICARDCPANWNCDIREMTCYDCPRAVCTRPRDQNIMIKNYHPRFNDIGLLQPNSIVNVGGNASHVIDEFWGTTYADLNLRLLEPRYVAYVCGDLFPMLEVSFPQPMRVVSFALNGWGDETFLRPPSFWTLEGSNDAPLGNRTWTEVGTANAEDWLTNEAHIGYPFEASKIRPAHSPAYYQYYRLNVRCDDLALGLLIENWALFISGDDPLVHDAFDEDA